MLQTVPQAWASKGASRVIATQTKRTAERRRNVEVINSSPFLYRSLAYASIARLETKPGNLALRLLREKVSGMTHEPRQGALSWVRRRLAGISGGIGRNGRQLVPHCERTGLRPNVLRMPARRQRSQGKSPNCQLRCDGALGAGQSLLARSQDYGRERQKGPLQITRSARYLRKQIGHFCVLFQA